ncbi:MAG: transposase, partial [Planctomycetaceae bacterium]
MPSAFSGRFQRYYYVLGTLGRKSDQVGSSVLGLVRRVVPLPDRILLAIDDTLTKRYGPHVEGAGIH